ncbi:hypothetical protein PMAYCL1PPCAC_11137, partial [Pristionchus mayeri]
MRALFWLCIGFSSLFLFYALLSTQIFSFDFDYLKELVPATLTVDEVSLFSTCILAEFDKDGWTKEIIEKSQIDWDPIKKCDENFTPFTVLGKNGTVWLNKTKKGVEEVNCWARAIYFKDDWRYNASGWFALTNSATEVVFNSDFVHTSCQKAEDMTEVVEDFVHLQMWNANDDGGTKKKKEKKNASTKRSSKFPTPSKSEKEEDVDEKPSVFIFVLDSVANSQAIRSLPKTISLMEHEFDSVNLRHVNKVGENSHPNGIAFLIGKMISDMDRGIFGKGKETAEWNETHACYRYFDDEPFILKEFTKKGYKSLMAEDWANGVFNYPNCWGFKNAPVTHYMRPFQVYYEEDLKQSRELMGEEQCFEYHTFLFNYLTKFMHAYKESPKIAMVWASEVAHNYNDGLFHLDGYLFNYFKEHRKVLDKSYVFLMGDHGIRWGKIRNTWIGDREINNPMMFVSVPRYLRERVNPVLKKNSGELLTSFDIYASLVDILNEPQLRAFTGPRGLRGNSFFRPLPPGKALRCGSTFSFTLHSGERSCRTLPIPVQFCLCEWNKTKSENEELNDKIGRGAVKLINAKLRELQIADSCEEYTFKTVKEVKKIDRTDGLTEILFSTVECEAEFKTIVRVRPGDAHTLNVSLAASDFTRWNSYGDTAACMNSRPSLRPLCCCRTTASTEATTTISSTKVPKKASVKSSSPNSPSSPPPPYPRPCSHSSSPSPSSS